MSTGQITTTSVTGPAVALTAKVFSNVTDLQFQIARGVLTISFSDANGPRVLDVSLSSITTVTYSISSGNATVTVS